MEGCHGWIQLFRKDRPGHQGWRAALEVREQLGCTELCLGRDDEPTDSLCVRIRGQPVVGDIAVHLCYRPPDQEEVDEAKKWKKLYAHKPSRVRALRLH